MLIWIFGEVQQSEVTTYTKNTAAGHLQLQKARVNWMLSIDANALPADCRAAGKRTYRTLTINNEAFEFSEGFTELHTKSYEQIIAGHGFPVSETRAAIQLVHEIRKNSSFSRKI